MSTVPKYVCNVSNDIKEYLPKFRHLYRALLREATYLPVSAARTFAYNVIVNRFNPPNPQKLNPRYWGTNYFRARFDLEKVKKRSRKATQKLRLLERINREGSLKDLQDVLFRTYGRSGKRRRVLLTELLRPGEDELPQDDTALSRIIDSQIAKNLDATKDVEVEKAVDVPKRQRRERNHIRMFLASQQESSPIESLRGRIKRLEPDIPATNIWGRKLPLKRKENMKRRWWAEVLERVLPPLPEHEWNHLADLAEGRQPIEVPCPRRKEAISDNPNELTSNTERMNSLLVPARVNLNHWDHQKGNINRDEPIDLADPSKKHSRERTMRRIYGVIWSLSAKMVWDQNTKEYTITWGGQRSAAASGKIPQPSLEEAELFEILEK